MLCSITFAATAILRAIRHISADFADGEPRKRARTASCHHEDDRYSDIREDEEFWFEDGTIVLLSGQVKFRVYRGVLTEHSPVFVDMLSLPQPALCEDAQYSCPVMQLQDHPETLRHVFRLLMHRKTAWYVAYAILMFSTARLFTVTFSFVAADSSPTFDMVSAYIRIVHKYQMDHFPRSVARLS